jgi:translation initiation factor 1
MKKKQKKIDVSGGQDSLGHHAFAHLDLGTQLPAGPVQTNEQVLSKKPPKKAIGSGLRLEVKREKAGRGGKTVTVIYGVQTLENRLKDSLVKDMKRRFATGGSNMGQHLELQGDLADAVVDWLEQKGYRAIRAGG